FELPLQPLDRFPAQPLAAQLLAQLVGHPLAHAVESQPRRAPVAGGGDVQLVEINALQQAAEGGVPMVTRRAALVVLTCYIALRHAFSRSIAAVSRGRDERRRTKDEWGWWAGFRLSSFVTVGTPPGRRRRP